MLGFNNSHCYNTTSSAGCHFRSKSYFSDIADGVISGFGAQGYEFALNAAIQHINKQ